MKIVYGFLLVFTFVVSYNLGKMKSINLYNGDKHSEENFNDYSNKSQDEKKIENQKNSIFAKKSWEKLLADKDSIQRKELFSGIKKIQKSKQKEETKSLSQSLENIRPNSKEVFYRLKNKADELNDSPEKQAQVYSLMVKLTDMKESVKNEILKSLVQLPPPIEMQESEIRSYEDQLRFKSTSPEELAFYIKYNNYVKLSVDQEEVFNQTIDLFKIQKNKKVKLFLASIYLVNKGEFTNRFIDEIGQDVANQLVPPHIEIRRTIDGKYKFIDLIIPKKK